MKRFCLLLLCRHCLAAVADEGMWTFDNFPKAAVKQKYGVDIDDPWLGRVQRSITRLESGCTGSFVSPDGLVLTNHHCAMDCLAELSSAQRRISSRTASTPANRAGERKCPTRNHLRAGRHRRHHRAGERRDRRARRTRKANEVRKQTLSRLEAACTASSKKNRARRRSPANR